ncbi:hypothetical protein CC78DRAFT_528091 [Lojkania enalia]|uniref:Mid2 domain-containing protein n=1 Tax=Lojkania enalia TaxID=147567 RepID=A0A9P4TR55_9PLEO|nr:hypothetical protein CC78DRAFT_528091 [Didymosphaeria enalia]
MYSLICPLAVAALVSSSLAQTCYFPNGNVVPSDTACNPNALVSACCFDGQACLSNGLCVSDPHDETLARTHRGTCTDKNWKSGNCPRHCLSLTNRGANVYSCNQTDVDAYCCFDNCECKGKDEMFSFAGLPEEVYTITIIGEEFTQTSRKLLSSSTRSVSSSVMSTDVPESTETIQGYVEEVNRSSSNSTAIGVGVGVGIGVAALIGAAGFFFWRRRSRNAYRNSMSLAMRPLGLLSNDHYSHPQPEAERYAYYASNKAFPSPTTTPELSGATVIPVELQPNPLPKAGVADKYS